MQPQRRDYASDMAEHEAQQRSSPRAIQLHGELVALEASAADTEQREFAGRMARFCYWMAQGRKDLHPDDERDIRSWFPELGR